MTWYILCLCIIGSNLIAEYPYGVMGYKHLFKIYKSVQWRKLKILDILHSEDISHIYVEGIASTASEQHRTHIMCSMRENVSSVFAGCIERHLERWKLLRERRPNRKIVIGKIRYNNIFVMRVMTRTAVMNNIIMIDENP